MYREKYAVGNRFDPPEVIYIKRMLQVALPAQLRARITDELFARYVSRDESTFARDLYMNEEQIKALLDSGMMVGGHGYNHDWLNRLDPSELALDIDRSMDFLRQLGVKTSDWVMCYPYGPGVSLCCSYRAPEDARWVSQRRRPSQTSDRATLALAPIGYQ